MSEIQGLGYMRNLLAKKQERVSLRYKHYEMKNRPRDLLLTANTKVGFLNSMLGWIPKAVDSLADRLVFKGWKNDNFNLSQIFQMNNPDIFFDSAIISALIGGCSFVYVGLDKEDFPRLEVIDGRDATGIIDPVTNLLTEGYAVLERDPKTDVPVLEAYFLPDTTTYIRKGGDPETFLNPVGIPLLVPIIYRPDAKRPMGHSRISRASMSLLQGACRTVKRSEVSAEFYSFPQKYIIGLSQEEDEAFEKWKATMSTFLTITKDEDGDSPTVGQFTQQNMTPFTEQLRTFAALFAGENGLTLDDLGFVSDNPSSAEAIKASHESLRLTARKAQRTFGSCFLNVGMVSACLRDNKAYRRQQFYLTEPMWEPIFEPDAAALSSIGDGAIKLNQAVPGYFNTDNLPDLTGIDPSQLPAPVAEDANG